MSVGLLCSSFSNLFALTPIFETRGISRAGFPRIMERSSLRIRHWFFMSTSNPWLRRKSAPRMCCRTSAMMNSQRYLCPRRWRNVVRTPYERIGDPLAAVSGGPRCPDLWSSVDAGIKETSAPLSTRKFLPEISSLTYSAVDVTTGLGAQADRAFSFPGRMNRVICISSPLPRIAGDRSSVIRVLSSLMWGGSCFPESLMFGDFVRPGRRRRRQGVFAAAVVVERQRGLVVLWRRRICLPPWPVSG